MELSQECVRTKIMDGRRGRNDIVFTRLKREWCIEHFSPLAGCQSVVDGWAIVARTLRLRTAGSMGQQELNHVESHFMIRASHLFEADKPTRNPTAQENATPACAMVLHYG